MRSMWFMIAFSTLDADLERLELFLPVAEAGVEVRYAWTGSLFSWNWLPGG